jgi:hypothetical protein
MVNTESCLSDGFKEKPLACLGHYPVGRFGRMPGLGFVRVSLDGGIPVTGGSESGSFLINWKKYYENLCGAPMRVLNVLHLPSRADSHKALESVVITVCLGTRMRY